MAGSYNNCILEDWCRAAWKGDDWLNPVCAGQDQYAGMQVLKEIIARAVYSHSRNCSCCCPAKFLSGNYVSFFHSVQYHVLL